MQAPSRAVVARTLACSATTRALSTATLTAPTDTTTLISSAIRATITAMQALRSTRHGLPIALYSRGFLTAAAYRLAQKQMPKMSETEKVALGCGTVGFDLS